MAENSAASIFVPILIIVVIEISQSAREFDLIHIAKRKQEPFFYSVYYVLDRSSQQRIRIPQLGPFNFIQGMNLAILYLGYILIMLTSSGNVRIVTSLIVWLFWVLFPMIEVYEYVHIMDDPEIGPVSFLFHSVLATVASGYVFFFRDTINTPVQVGQIQVQLILFAVGIIALYYVHLTGFLTLLERELEKCSPSDEAIPDHR